MPVQSRLFEVKVYDSSLQFPLAAINALKDNEHNANCILPMLLKSRLAETNGDVPPQKQVWLTCTSRDGPNVVFELIVSVTEGYIDSYPVFLLSTIPIHRLTQDFLRPRMSQIAHALLRAIPVRRVYSVFGPDLLSRVFTWTWTEMTGIRYIERPYYEAKMSFCTRQTFRHQPITIRPDLTYEIRPASENDLMEIAELCFGFAEDSEPFFLTQEGAIREASILIRRNQVWIHRIARRGDPRSEIASIVAFTRNSETNTTITKVFTSINWRRLGCAERLVREVCNFLLQTKITVTLFVAHDNPGAASVYSRVGFLGLDPQEGPVPGVDNWTEIGFDRSVVRLGHW